jgi:hypothetical protein
VILIQTVVLALVGGQGRLRDPFARFILHEHTGVLVMNIHVVYA